MSTLPFAGFYESYGAGTRHNDHKLDLSRVTAYEVNMVAKAGESPEGVVIFNALTSY